MTLSAAIEKILSPRPARYYDRVDSTNDLAVEWLREGAPTGAVVIADEQLKGRGRLGRIWHTPAGMALAVSVILHPKPAVLSQVSMLGALAIVDVCLQTGLNGVGIKWPNDVQINGRKVSGILPEVVWQGEQLLGVVLGIGLNVRNDFRDTELAQSAVTLETALGQPVDRQEILVTLLECVDAWYKHIGGNYVFDAWKGRLTTLGQQVTVLGGIQGKAETVDGEGALWVRTEDAALHRVIAGDIALG